jgi:hypothetical protein
MLQPPHTQAPSYAAAAAAAVPFLHGYQGIVPGQCNGETTFHGYATDQSTSQGGQIQQYLYRPMSSAVAAGNLQRSHYGAASDVTNNKGIQNMLYMMGNGRDGMI